MHTHTTTLYAFSELSPESQARAIREHAEKMARWGNPWDSEWERSRREFADAFHVKTNFRDGGYVSTSLEHNGMTGIRLWKWIRVNLAVTIHEFLHAERTGYCGDADYVRPLYEFLQRPDKHSDMDQLLRECLQSGDYAWEKDTEFQFSDEVVRETLECDSSEIFEEDGSVY